MDRALNTVPFREKPAVGISSRGQQTSSPSYTLPPSSPHVFTYINHISLHKEFNFVIKGKSESTSVGKQPET